MAPAGSFPALMAAIASGADSVYFGVEQLNMRRVSSANFTMEDVEKIVTLTHQARIKAYMTLNTILYDHDLSLMRLILDEAADMGIDAVIVSDQAAIMYALQKNIPVHISTQVNITNIESVRFYAHFADTVVLSRELSLRQIAAIVAQIQKENITGPSGKLVRVEIFGHGALCMAVSGKCYLSLHTHNASANRGACRQNCRKKYLVKDEDGQELEIDNEYIMSPKDLLTIDFLDKIIDSGVEVLKIEGRGRAADYVATTIQTYRAAIDAYYQGTYNRERVQEWIAQLRTVYNRDFWGGYYLGAELGEWTKDHPGSHATRKKVYVGKGERYYPQKQIAQFKIESYEVKKGDKMLVISPFSGVKEFILEGFRVNDAEASYAGKGAQLTLPLDCKIRSGDKLYKLLEEQQ